MSEPKVDLSKLYDAVLTGDAQSSVELTKAALDEGVLPQDLVNKYMIPAMNDVGSRFECNEYFLPELLISAEAMKGALALIRPLLASSGVEPVGRVVIGTVKGDLHDVGKSLVASLLEGGGFDVTDLGVDVPADKFVAEAKDKNADVVAVSALLSTTRGEMKAVIDSLQAAGVRDKVKVIVGGAPVTQEYADSIGADGYSDNANGAVTVTRNLVAK